MYGKRKENKAKITLNYQTYPLVVGNADKYTFSSWETCGSTVLLEPVIRNEDYSIEDIRWEVEDDSIAEVEVGLVRAKTTGFTAVRASLPSGDEACCEIVMIDNITRSTTLRIELNTDRLILEKGKETDILAFLYPEDVLNNGAMNRIVRFESLDKAVAEVDHNGRITAVSEGETEIRVISEDIGRVASCKVQVISKEEMEGSQINEVVWKSSNPYIATVDALGEVTFRSAGEAKIYETAILGGKRKEYSVSGKPLEVKAEKIFLSQSDIHTAVGEQRRLYGLASPASVTRSHFQWKIADQEIAEIVSVKENDFGAEEVSIRALKEGSTVIEASYHGKNAVCRVCVGSKRDLANLYVETGRKLQIEEVCQLNFSCEKGTSNHELFWLSDDRECVSVNQEGTVKAYASGSVKVFCILGDDLATEERYQLWEMSQVRRLKSDPYWTAKLHKIREHAVYGISEIVIEEEAKHQRCLRNLHVVKEAVTSDSVMLLWNRASLRETGDFSHYLVVWRKQGEGASGIPDEGKVQTKKLGYTADGLESDTGYEFCVTALDKQDRALHSQTVYARTKKREELINVMMKPYCAAGDGRTMDTYAIQKAIDDCPEQGTVLLPAGCIFFCGALFLKSNMTFLVEGTLIGSTDPKDYPLVVTRWEGWRKLEQSAEKWANSTEAVPENHMSHASLINAGVYDEGQNGKSSPWNVENIVIKGHGMINGNGFKLGYNEGPNHYDADGGLPVPFSTRLDPNLRGRVIALHNGRNIYVKDVTVCYGPSWTIHTIYCSHVTFDHITVISKGTGKTGASDDICILNGDGIDPDSSHHVNVFDTFFFTGDDAVAIKSGRDREGNELNKPSAYIRVTDCASVGSKGGFCIGSEQSGGAHDILWQNLLVKDVDLFGLWIKASPSRGGLVRDILWKDCFLTGTQGGIFLEDRYHGPGNNPARVLPEICHIVFENIHSCRQKYFGVKIAGLEDSYIHDILFKDCSFEEIQGNDEEAFEVICGQNIVIQDTVIPEESVWSADEVSTILIEK